MPSTLTSEEYHSELENVITTRNKFFAIVAHDVKGPIGNILQLATLMRDPKNRTDEMVEVLQNAALQTFTLLDNLLTWSRSQRGLIQYSPSQIDVSGLVNECFGLLASQAAEKNISLINKSPKNLYCFADLNMMQTVVRNLVSNAIKFTRKGGHVTLEAAYQNENFIEIRVIDDGIGMTAEYQRDLFTNKKTISKQGTEGERGTGLGLVLCHEFIERNNGKISVISEKDKGSTFRFTLPIFKGD